MTNVDVKPVNRKNLLNDVGKHFTSTFKYD